MGAEMLTKKEDRNGRGPHLGIIWRSRGILWPWRRTWEVSLPCSKPSDLRKHLPTFAFSSFFLPVALPVHFQPALESRARPPDSEPAYVDSAAPEEEGWKPIEHRVCIEGSLPAAVTAIECRGSSAPVQLWFMGFINQPTNARLRRRCPHAERISSDTSCYMI